MCSFYLVTMFVIFQFKPTEIHTTQWHIHSHTACYIFSLLFYAVMGTFLFLYYFLMTTLVFFFLYEYITNVVTCLAKFVRFQYLNIKRARYNMCHRMNNFIPRCCLTITLFFLSQKICKDYICLLLYFSFVKRLFYSNDQVTI